MSHCDAPTRIMVRRHVPGPCAERIVWATRPREPDPPEAARPPGGSRRGGSARPAATLCYTPARPKRAAIPPAAVAELTRAIVTRWGGAGR